MWLLLGAAPEVDSKECHFDFELPDDPHCLEELEEMRGFFGLEAYEYNSESICSL